LVSGHQFAQPALYATTLHAYYRPTTPAPTHTPHPLPHHCRAYRAATPRTTALPHKHAAPARTHTLRTAPLLPAQKRLLRERDSTRYHLCLPCLPAHLPAAPAFACRTPPQPRTPLRAAHYARCRTRNLLPHGTCATCACIALALPRTCRQLQLVQTLLRRTGRTTFSCIWDNVTCGKRRAGPHTTHHTFVLARHADFPTCPSVKKERMKKRRKRENGISHSRRPVGGSLLSSPLFC